MKLQEQIELKLAHTPLTDIAAMMGYGKNGRHKAALRIADLMKSDDLGIGSGSYDFKYSAVEFAEQLCKLLAIPATEYMPAIEQIKKELQIRNRTYKPWLFVDTNFKRTSQPVFVLAALEKLRQLPLTIVAEENDATIVKKAQQKVVHHFGENGGTLQIWGDICRYTLYLSAGEQIAISPQGLILKQINGFRFSHASMSIANRDAGVVLSNKASI